jgi:hypothetical protein
MHRTTRDIEPNRVDAAMMEHSAPAEHLLGIVIAKRPRLDTRSADGTSADRAPIVSTSMSILVVERLIGTIRREYLDRVFGANAHQG